MQREAVAANEDLGKDLEHVEVRVFTHMYCMYTCLYSYVFAILCAATLTLR